MTNQSTIHPTFLQGLLDQAQGVYTVGPNTPTSTSSTWTNTWGPTQSGGLFMGPGFSPNTVTYTMPPRTKRQDIQESTRRLQARLGSTMIASYQYGAIRAWLAANSPRYQKMMTTVSNWIYRGKLRKISDWAARNPALEQKVRS